LGGTISSCPVGSYCPGSGIPVGCPTGMLCAQPSLSAPLTCPAGAFCSNSTRLPSDCPPGSYCHPGSSAPVLCPIGSVCNNARMSSPVPCTAGMYCSVAGSTSTAGVCGVGNYSFTGDSTCSQCPIGLFNPSTGRIFVLCVVILVFAST
jgi:hypothetical protein